MGENLSNVESVKQEPQEVIDERLLKYRKIKRNSSAIAMR